MDNLDIVDGKGKIKKGNETSNFTGQFAYNDEITSHKLVPYLGNSSEFKLITTGDFKGTLEDSSGGHYFTDWRNKGQTKHDSNNNKNDYKEWLILYRVPANDTRLKEKLKARASSLGLVNKQPGGNGNKNSTDDDFFGMLVDRFTD